MHEWIVCDGCAVFQSPIHDENHGEKEWQSKSVVEMACASTMGTAPLMGGMCFGASQTNQPCAH